MQKLNPAKAELLFQELRKVERKDIATPEKIKALYRLLNGVFIEATHAEKLQFTTFFARIAYASQQFSLPRQLQFYIHHFRKMAQGLSSSPNTDSSPNDYLLGVKVIAESISTIYEVAIPQDIATLIPDHTVINASPVPVKSFRHFAKVVAMGIDNEQSQLIVRDQANPTDPIRVQFNIPDRNENFNPTIKHIRTIFGFPTSLNLLDIEVDDKGIYRPKGFVIEPDYLVDVTAIAECFKDIGKLPQLYLLKKFMPFVSSKYSLIGNIANFFLDELMTNTEITFKDTFPKVFQMNPLAFIHLSNPEVMEIRQKCQRHFLSLKEMVMREFSKQQIHQEHCFLEPSFYSVEYGIQGRLDVLYNSPDEESKPAIVELKSGKLYKPNIHGLCQNHYIQTLMYNLLIRSTFKKAERPMAYILYSGLDREQLKYAPPNKSQQFEAIQLRNALMAIEQSFINLSKRDPEKSNIFHYISPAAIPKARGFLATDLQTFQNAYQGMDEVERQYFERFTAFIAREHQLAKTGIQGIETVNGLASLWLNPFSEKQANFEIISFLTIETQKVQDEDPEILFQKTDQTNKLANFRRGDIAVLYPFKDIKKTVLNDQVFKCTILEINKTHVKVRLRYKQFNQLIFQQDSFWNLEHDLMDSGFVSMYRSLFAFGQFPKYKKDLLLCRQAPKRPVLLEFPAPVELTAKQQEIFKQVISTEDYFLLWGPPGTGKTSMMLKHLVAHLINHTDEEILLLAYTNRAVDEICESIEAIDGLIKNEYIRIGSRFSTAKRFQGQLLNNKIANVRSRKELIEILKSHRIIVSTVASIVNKPELLALKSFHTAIIDEASQILEPILAGLLPSFKRFILIGDHKQLPAVVVQSPEESKVNNPKLEACGLKNLRDSLFERLFRKCQEYQWDWAFAQLSQQGRMHQDIMDFPNNYFYGRDLSILPEGTLGAGYQSQPLDLREPENASALEKILSHNRKLFFPTSVDEDSANFKTNGHEAKQVAEIVLACKRVYAASGKEWHAGSLGIITPYRAQIASIQKALEEHDLSPEELTVDTVERYQGGARDIIVISLCLNRTGQTDSISSFSEEGVDRKLNVALTRARQQLFVLGNEDIMRENVLYGKLIDWLGKETRVEKRE